MFKIEKNIPSPSSDEYGYDIRQLKEVMNIMMKGDSIFVPSKKLRANSHSIAKSLGIAVETKTEGEGYRVWRVV